MTAIAPASAGVFKLQAALVQEGVMWVPSVDESSTTRVVTIEDRDITTG
ncbi:hypothetical protein WKW79_22515 [Variovorax robiniae]|uniref:Phage tail protein n=1 Tax=Variovorax robiniae TaxID=1836199 RepID=A0ABU8XE85_9BURK